MQRNAEARRVAGNAVRRRSWATSAIIAGALFLGPCAGIAHADAVNWDAVAVCESGGNWHANTGNGFYGGLQFKESTWQKYGGVGSPASASRNEQIAVADRVLAEQGPSAWPKCGPNQPGQWQATTNQVLRLIWGFVPH